MNEWNADVSLKTRSKDRPAPRDGAATTQHWRWVRAQLEREYGSAQYERWLKPLRLDAVESGVARIHVPTDFMRDWVERNYLTRIRTLLAAGPEPVSDVCVLVGDGAGSAEPAADGAPAPRRGPRRGAVTVRRPGNGANVAVGEDSFGGRLEPRYSFDRFVVGKSNAFAHAAARRVAESRSIPFNPLFLHGGVGLGKTHLMHAIAWEYMKNFPERKVVYISA
ncbi:MAG: chromosomal replication initiator protein DnaA, partial [Alphaproteobacteria bacterium]